MNRLAFTTATLAGSFADKAVAIRQAGFEATELWARDLFDHLEGPEVALRVLRDQGLAVSAFQAIRNLEGYRGPVRQLKFDIACRMMDLACLAGSPIVTLAANVDAQASGDRGRLADDLGQAAELAAQRGLRLAYEPICWAPHVSSWRRALALIAAVDHGALGLQLDVFHPLIQGEIPDVFEIPLDKLFLVEISDFVAGGMTPREVSRGHRLFPGEGSAPLEPVLRGLAARGYAGDIAVEVFNAEYGAQPPAAVAARGWRCVNQLLDRTAQRRRNRNEIRF